MSKKYEGLTTAQIEKLKRAERLNAKKANKKFIPKEQRNQSVATPIIRDDK